MHCRYRRGGGGVYGVQPIEKALAEADRLMYIDKNASKEEK